eukprot:2933909-Rhodomonas_salina.1
MARGTVRAIHSLGAAGLRAMAGASALHSQRFPSPPLVPLTRSIGWLSATRVFRVDVSPQAMRPARGGLCNFRNVLKPSAVPVRWMSSGPAVSWLSTKLSKQLSKMGALQKVKEAAEKGDAKAMTLMGVCYGMGRDVEQDDAKAAEWFKKAADAGNGEACLAYGIWLLGGKGGVARSAPEAVKYLQVAEKGGVTQAQTVLGIIFMSGDDGVVRDSTKALKLFTKAAEAGDA